MKRKILLDPSSVVVVIEPQSSIRMLITNTVRMLDFRQIKGFNDATEALEFLQSNRASWLIMPTLFKTKVNCLHVLKIISQNPKLKHMLCSLIIEPGTESFCLSKAFELGLFSYHPRSYSGESIKRDFLDLVTMLKVNQWDPVMVCSEFIRQFIKDQNHHQSSLAFEESLLSIYKGSTKILLKYAESQFLNQKEQDAIKSLQQVMVLNPKLASLCNRLKSKYSESADLVIEDSEEKSNLLDIKRCLIVDPDTDYLGFVSELLTNLGVESVETFESGEEAWIRFLQDPKPEYIFMEWKIPCLSGIQLIQRIRSKDSNQTTIIILSSLIKPEEIPLLHEMGANGVLNKPFESQDFYTAITWTAQQNNRPTEQNSLEMKIRKLLKDERLDEAKRLIGVYLSDPLIKTGDKCLIQAEYESACGHMSRCIDLAIHAANHGKKDDPYTLNLIGHSLIKEKAFDAALIFLERAHKLCPGNVSRLTNISLSHCELDHKDQAMTAINEAKTIDKDNDLVLNQEGRVLLENGDSSKAAEVLAKMDSISKIVSNMNSRAIALAKAGRYEDSVSLYKNTLDAIPKVKKQERNAVTYNLSLAYARYGDLENTLATLDKISMANEELQKKASSLKAKVVKCLNTNSALSLSEGDEIKIIEQDQSSLGVKGVTIDYRNYEVSKMKKIKDLIPVRQMMESIDIQPGDLCCHMIYHCIEGHDDRCDEMLKETPSFAVQDVSPWEEPPTINDPDHS